MLVTQPSLVDSRFTHIVLSICSSTFVFAIARVILELGFWAHPLTHRLPHTPSLAARRHPQLQYESRLYRLLEGGGEYFVPPIPPSSLLASSLPPLITFVDKSKHEAIRCVTES